MDDVLEEALAMLLDQLKDQPLTAEDIRRECIDFVTEHVEDVEREEVEAVYDGLYAMGKVI
jgi:(p)ppGpp synthase/HD superfamily hydrolase